MRRHLKHVLKENLEKLMDSHPDRDTPTKLARFCYWPRGDRAGSRIAPRTIAYIFEEDAQSPAPSLDIIEALSIAFGIEPWQLLTDTEEAKRRAFEVIVGGVKPRTSAITFQEVELPLTQTRGQNQSDRKKPRS